MLGSPMFTADQAGPGGTGVLAYTDMGGAQPGVTPLKSPDQSPTAPGNALGYTIPPVAWMFVFLIVGYWGLHMTLKAV